MINSSLTTIHYFRVNQYVRERSILLSLQETAGFKIKFGKKPAGTLRHGRLKYYFLLIEKIIVSLRQKINTSCTGEN